MLSIKDLQTNYGRLVALRDVSFAVAKSEILCVVGPNGAGKSTLLLTISGVLKPSRGSIILHSTEIANRPPEAIARLGASLVPEGRHIFASLTVSENLAIGATTRKDRQQVNRDLQNLLNEFPILRERLSVGAGKLSGGEQQQLAIARALLSKPHLMMIDEPSLGLAPKVTDQVYQILRQLRDRLGLTLIIVEQSVERALRIADKVLLLRNGNVIVYGDAANIETQLRDAYFGLRQAPTITEVKAR